jgi:hypothetical protein
MDAEMGGKTFYPEVHTHASAINIEFGQSYGHSRRSTTRPSVYL